MKKTQGRVKTIPIGEPKVGMQVYAPFYDFFNRLVWGVFTIERIPVSIYMKENGIKPTSCYVKNAEGTLHAGGTESPTDIKLSDLRQLVVEHANWSFVDGVPAKGFSGKRTYYPLKESQWNTAIANGLIGTDKEVEFQLEIPFDGKVASEISLDPKLNTIAALVIPKAKQQFTREDMEMAFQQGCMHRSYYPNESKITMSKKWMDETYPNA